MFQNELQLLIFISNSNASCISSTLYKSSV